MALTAIETIALIFALFALIKLIVVVINKKIWYNKVAKPIYSNPRTTAIIFVILAVVIFYYLLQVFSIVQIFAVLAFASILIGLGFLSFSKDLMPLVTKAYNRKFTGWEILYTIIWLILLLWALYEILV